MQLKIDNKELKSKNQLHHHQHPHQQHHHHHHHHHSHHLQQQQQQQQQHFQQQLHNSQQQPNQQQQQQQSEQDNNKNRNLININKLPKLIMSEDVELMFNSGSIVFVETCYDNSIEGEVIAFDYNKKVLLLKCSSSSGNSGFNDIHFINLEYVKDVQIKKDVKNEENNNCTLPVVNLQKVEERVRTATDERKRITNAFAAGITEDGIKVFLNLSKTVGNTTWNSKDIIVLHTVSISPPYKPQNCMPIGNLNDRKSKEAVSYVKLLLDQYWSTRASEPIVKNIPINNNNNNTNATATNSNSNLTNTNNTNSNLAKHINSNDKICESPAQQQQQPQQQVQMTNNSGQLKSKQFNERTITQSAKSTKS